MAATVFAVCWPLVKEEAARGAAADLAAGVGADAVVVVDAAGA